MGKVETQGLGRKRDSQLAASEGKDEGREATQNVHNLGFICKGCLKEMATHSSILAWRIPWTEEPGGLQSMGSQRVRYD